MKPRKLLLALATLLLPLTASAQYSIYPVPHSQTAGTGTKVTFTKSVNIVCDADIDSYTIERAKTILAEHGFTATTSSAASSTLSNIYLGVANANGLPKAAANKIGLNLSVLTKSGKFDRHVLSLTNAHDGVAQLIIIGENTDATFMGLASLEQMLDANNTQMPTVTISDYADLKERGIIEGFYGKPYSSEVRKDLLRFMMRNKMNCYVYGPKSDVYHSGKWEEAYPTTLTESQRKSGFVTQQDLREFTTVAHQTKVSVVWAIHPGDGLLNDNNVVSKIISKFDKMYDLGFRQFAVFADDVSIPDNQSGMKLTASRITDLQKNIDNRWNGKGASEADKVKPLRFTPQIYCRNFAGSAWQFNQFFKALSAIPSEVTIYYTGGGVWSVPNNADLNTVQQQFGRNVIWWWNYPCNDNGTGPSEIYPLDMRSNFVDMPNVENNAQIATQLTASNQGILCNPMEQGSAARTAVFSAGDYSWNNLAFNNNASWEASFKALFPRRPQLQKVYRFLAPYLSKNDPASLGTAIEAYKTGGDGTALSTLMQQIVDNCDVLATMEQSGEISDQLLYIDIRPWVLRLRAMAAATKGFIACKQAGDAIEAWAHYLPSVKLASQLSSAADYMTSHMSGFGSDGITTDQRLTHASWRYLTPFAGTYLGKHALEGFFTAATGSNTILTNATSHELTLTQTDDYVALHGSVFIPSKGYAGIALAQPTNIKQIYIEPAIFNAKSYNFVYSTDGKVWKEMTAGTMQTDEFVHYVVALNVSGKTTRLSLDNSAMRITLYNNKPEKPTNVTLPAYNYWDGHSKALLTDGNYATYLCLNRDMVVGDSYTLELGQSTNIENVRICMGTTNGDYPKAATVSISTDGNNWTPLTVKGTRVREYSMSLQQNFYVATEPANGTDVMALDFVPTDDAYNVVQKKAKYVRFQVTEIWGQPKWLRLHEIEVNGLPAPVLTALTDADGNNIEAATDADGTTYTNTYIPSTTGGGSFTYRFLNVNAVKGLLIFCDEASMQGVSYTLTTDGTTWQSVAPENKGGVVRFAFDKDIKPLAVQIKWSGSAVPGIYEAVEQVDETAGKPVITGISATTTSTDAALSVAMENGRLVAQATEGIAAVQLCTADGRQLMSLQLGGAKKTCIPVVAAHGQLLIANITLANGKNATYKIATR